MEDNSNNDIIEKLKKILDSDEGKAIIAKMGDKISRGSFIKNRQLQLFHDKYSNRFDEIIEKVITKYNSDGYYQRWMRKSIEPPEPLYMFLYDYAVKFGDECSDIEWEEYGNMFTGSLYYINGYYFNLMVGQGTVVNIIKKHI